jgi:hypothetical protein
MAGSATAKLLNPDSNRHAIAKRGIERNIGLPPYRSKPFYGTAAAALQKQGGAGLASYAANLNVNAAKCSSFPSAAMRANIR